MMQHSDSTELDTDHVSNNNVLAICRNHLESLQNLSYMTSLEADHPMQVRLHIRMMEWHLYNLSEALLPIARTTPTVIYSAG
jgi:hypothetical protein